jgi:hypothetical protein
LRQYSTQRSLFVKPFLVLWLAAGLAAPVVRGAENVDVRIYSEFQRFDPFGNPLAQDREIAPREILSPAVARNGHLSVHVVVTAPEGANFFVYTGSNPPGILELKLYREYFTRCGESYCPDWLAEQKSASFASIPELYRDPVHPEMNRQTTRSWLLDIWVRPDTPPRRVRVEALIKTGTWIVAPMEMRILAPIVPDTKSGVGDTLYRVVQGEDIAPLEEPASATAERQLLRYLAGVAPEIPPAILRERDIIQRNAAEDMLLARTLERRNFPELNLLAWWPFLRPSMGAEWYLRVRDFLYRFES